jgi:hypothetical protein
LIEDACVVFCGHGPPKQNAKRKTQQPLASLPVRPSLSESNSDFLVSLVSFSVCPARPPIVLQSQSPISVHTTNTCTHTHTHRTHADEARDPMDLGLFLPLWGRPSCLITSCDRIDSRYRIHTPVLFGFNVYLYKGRHTKGCLPRFVFPQNNQSPSCVSLPQY